MEHYKHVFYIIIRWTYYIFGIILFSCNQDKISVILFCPIIANINIVHNKYTDTWHSNEVQYKLIAQYIDIKLLRMRRNQCSYKARMTKTERSQPIWGWEIEEYQCAGWMGRHEWMTKTEGMCPSLGPAKTSGVSGEQSRPGAVAAVWARQASQLTSYSITVDIMKELEPVR